MKLRFLSSHFFFRITVTSFPFLSYVSFLTVNPETYFFYFFAETATFIMLLAIFSTVFTSKIVSNSIVSEDSSSKHPITLCFIAFVVAPEIEWTETMDFILRFNLQPSTFLISESPRIKVFFTEPFFNFGFSFSSFFLSVSLLFSFAKSEDLSL